MKTHAFIPCKSSTLFFLFTFFFTITSNVFGQGATLWGVSTKGGVAKAGTIYSCDNSGNQTVLYEFTGSASAPVGKLVPGNNGKLYGMTQLGGTYGYGTVFEFVPATNTVKFIFHFTSKNGANPMGSLLFNGNKLYGMTQKGGTFDQGVLFELDVTELTVFKVLYNFNTANGILPKGDLHLFKESLFGMTTSGGYYNAGVLFEYNITTAAYKIRYHFIPIRGYAPMGGLTQIGDRLYGLTSAGGNFSGGVLFSYNIVSGVYIPHYHFTATNGRVPTGSLLNVNNRLYGVTSQGGLKNAGVLFEYIVPNQVTPFKILYHFGDVNGKFPGGSLVNAGCNLFGTTPEGGLNNVGVLFTFNMTTGKYSVVSSFQLPTIANPTGTLYLAKSSFPPTCDPNLQLYSQEFIFKAQRQNTANAIQWIPLHLLTKGNFILERSGGDQQFTEISRMHVATVGTQKKMYQYLDVEPLPGLNQYRLIYENETGESWYSDIISITMPESHAFVVYPNPVRESMQVWYEAPEPGTKFWLMDASGRICIHEEWKMTGVQVESLNVEQLISGVYSAWIQVPGQPRKMQKVIITH